MKIKIKTSLQRREGAKDRIERQYGHGRLRIDAARQFEGKRIQEFLCGPWRSLRLCGEGLGWLAVPLLLAGCTLGPDYVKPTTDVPAAFKEAAGWQEARPADESPRGKWWEIFHDPGLNTLEEKVLVSNQNLKAAEAQYRQALALSAQARAALFPVLNATASTSRAESASAVANRSSTSGGVSVTHSLGLQATWEADLWGGVRRNVESGDASAQASAADLANTRLSLQASLAQNWFQLRALDAQKKLLGDTVAAYARALEMTRNRYQAGIVTAADVAQAETQLKSTQAQALDIQVQRAQLEHAIALLIGQPPAGFALPLNPLVEVAPPVSPSSLPSRLLERRPDVAAAERRVAAANAQIGVAKAAFFPDLSFSATGGWQSSTLAALTTAPSRYWSFGPALAQMLFDGGARTAKQDQATANWQASVAAYRQTVLNALGDVEDNLVALRLLEQEAAIQDEALKAARRSLELATNQYKAGVVSYLNVVSAQAAALSAEITANTLRNRRFAASIGLVKALGGGWKNSLNPSKAAE